MKEKKNVNLRFAGSASAINPSIDIIHSNVNDNSESFSTCLLCSLYKNSTILGANE